MSTVKIKLNTWNRCGNRETKFQRGLAPREGFVDMNTNTKQVEIKPGSKKWKTWDVSMSRYKDQAYIDNKRELYSGLCFNDKQQAKLFMQKHKKELDTLAKQNPLFDHWSVMYVNKRFDPIKKVIYGTDITE